MMEKYLINYLNITQDHVDPTDYDNFAEECIEYVKNNRKYISLVLESLNIFKNDELLSMSYKILRNTNGDKSIDICDNILRKHIKNTNLRDSVILYLSTTDKNICKKYILKTFYDKYEFNIEYCLIFNNSCYQEEFIKFLELQQPKFVERKLYAMIYTGRFYNIWEYIEDFGAEDKFRSSLVCNLFSLLVEKVQQAIAQFKGESCKQQIQTFFKNEFYVGRTFCYRCDKFILCIDENTFFIEMVGKERLNVRSANNFVVNFLKFMREEKEVIEWIKNGDEKKIKETLSRYILKAENFELQHYTDLETDDTNSNNYVEENEIDINFDYLFESKCLKSHADCAEP
ncbi:hypothetical protein THOM_2196 [Trachipleistophora hominis]|uniref:Uncharacterized protein n=1 Tax=Trachipleistophora hominis TaxID=72359 RepID=L7JVU3_TRAHO|nr:hypothetical protein THOM_2196 [Trachipleistophora hominis]